MTNPWKKLKQETIFDSGYRKLIRKTFELPNGKTHEFDIKDEMQVVCILGLTKENKVILVEEFRPGMEKTLLEIPGGQVEEGEDPTEAAKREFLEETGYTGEFQSVGTNYECAYSNQIEHGPTTDRYNDDTCRKAHLNISQDLFCLLKTIYQNLVSSVGLISE